MANIAVGDVTHLVLKQRKLADSRNSNLVRLSFGDGALTYPANGIPLSKAKMGCPTVIESMVIVDQGASGYKFQYDQSAEKLIILQAPVQTHTHDFKVIGGQAAAGTDALSAKTLTLGKEAASNITVAGANSATLGGVVSATLAAAALSEASTVAIAAQIIEVEIIGY